MAEAAVAKGGEVLQLVGFTVDNEEFGVEILKVQEIIRMVDITRVPNAPEFVEGVINLRGKVIPVIDFRKRFHLYGVVEDNRKAQRIVVVALAGITIGLVVDRVSQVIKLGLDQIAETPGSVKGYDSESISGIGKLGERLLILLDLEKLFGQGELEGLAQAA